MYQHITAIILLSESQTQTHVVADAFHLWNTEGICELDERDKTGIEVQGDRRSKQKDFRTLSADTGQTITHSSPWRLSLSQLFLDSEMGHL